MLVIKSFRVGLVEPLVYSSLFVLEKVLLLFFALLHLVEALHNKRPQSHKQTEPKQERKQLSKAKSIASARAADLNCLLEVPMLGVRAAALFEAAATLFIFKSRVEAFAAALVVALPFRCTTHVHGLAHLRVLHRMHLLLIKILFRIQQSCHLRDRYRTWLLERGRHNALVYLHRRRGLPNDWSCSVFDSISRGGFLRLFANASSVTRSLLKRQSVFFAVLVASRVAMVLATAEA